MKYSNSQADANDERTTNDEDDNAGNKTEWQLKNRNRNFNWQLAALLSLLNFNQISQDLAAP